MASSLVPPVRIYDGHKVITYSSISLVELFLVMKLPNDGVWTSSLEYRLKVPCFIAEPDGLRDLGDALCIHFLYFSIGLK